MRQAQEELQVPISGLINDPPPTECACCAQIPFGAPVLDGIAYLRQFPLWYLETGLQFMRYGKGGENA